MLLKSLEIHGFKSFAKKADLEFGTSIAAIVGPNGSGKSNVAEAFRFVLGEQSVKSMRGKRGEDLIFNGSNEAPRMSRASVKITFDNGRRFLDVDFDEVTLERIVHRDGSNEYKINGSTVRLKDITELLSKANIGSTGHHIISQGEADRILSANSKDRKAMIEDALGLRVYQYKISESERKLEKTRENIKEAELLRREIAPHLKYLKKQVEKIEKAKEMREKLVTMYHEYLKRESLYLASEKDFLDKNLSEPEKRLEELTAELSEATRVLEENKDNDERRAILVTLEEQIENIRKEKDGLTRELGQIEGELAGQEKVLKREQERYRESQPIPFEEVEKFSDEIARSIEHASRLDDMLTIKKTLTVIKDSFASFLAGFSRGDARSMTADIEHEMSLLEDKKDAVARSLAEVQVEEKRLEGEYQKLQREIEADKDTERSAETAVFRIRAERNEVQATLNTLRAREANYKKDRVDFEEELKEGAVLVGQVILQYKNYIIEDEAEYLSGEQVRKEQEDKRRAIERVKIKLEDMGGGSADETLKEYEDVSEREQYLIRELQDLEQTAGSLEQIIHDLEDQLEKDFNDGVGKINTEFQNYFSLMFGGGTAKLSLVKEAKRGQDEFEMEKEDVEYEEGVDISVSLPRKKVKGLMMLSGGERALTSIALLFAMSQVTPPPFIILDETDAALDEANSRKYGDMIENLSEKSQLILITHNRETMSRAGILYGVTMGSGGISKLLSVAFDEAARVAK